MGRWRLRFEQRVLVGHGAEELGGVELAADERAADELAAEELGAEELAAVKFGAAVSVGLGSSSQCADRANDWEPLLLQISSARRQTCCLWQTHRVLERDVAAASNGYSFDTLNSNRRFEGWRKIAARWAIGRMFVARGDHFGRTAPMMAMGMQAAVPKSKPAGRSNEVPRQC